MLPPAPSTPPVPLPRRPAIATPAPDRLDVARQRLARGLGFARELVKATRRDFGALWMPPASGAAPPGPRALAFRRRVDALTEQVVAGDRLLAALPARPPAEAIALAEGFDLRSLIAAAQAVEAEARALKGGAPGGPATGPLGAARPGAPAPARTAPLPARPGLPGAAPARPGTGRLDPAAAPPARPMPSAPRPPGTERLDPPPPARPGLPPGAAAPPRPPAGTAPLGLKLPTPPAPGRPPVPRAPTRPIAPAEPEGPPPPAFADYDELFEAVPEAPPAPPAVAAMPAEPPEPAPPPPRTAAQAVAAAAREAVGAARPAAPAKPGGLTGLLSRWTAPPKVETQAAPPPPVPPAVDAARRAFAAAHTLAGEVLAYVSPRLGIVRVALAATGLPGKRREMAEIQETLYDRSVAAGVPAEQMGFMPPITTLLHRDAMAAQRVHVALTQWDEARTLHGDATDIEARLQIEPPGRAAALQLFDVGRYRAAIFPISHLHVQFAPYAWLRDLFPAPAGT